MSVCITSILCYFSTGQKHVNQITWFISSSGTGKALDGNSDLLPGMFPTITPVLRPRPTHLITRLPRCLGGARLAVEPLVVEGAVVVLLFLAAAPLPAEVDPSEKRL